jgi:hypothetical protein
MAMEIAFPVRDGSIDAQGGHAFSDVGHQPSDGSRRVIDGGRFGGRVEEWDQL